MQYLALPPELTQRCTRNGKCLDAMKRVVLRHLPPAAMPQPATRIARRYGRFQEQRV